MLQPLKQAYKTFELSIKEVISYFQNNLSQNLYSGSTVLHEIRNQSRP